MQIGHVELHGLRASKHADPARIGGAGDDIADDLMSIPVNHNSAGVDEVIPIYLAIHAEPDGQVVLEIIECVVSIDVGA